MDEVRKDEVRKDEVRIGKGSGAGRKGTR